MSSSINFSLYYIFHLHNYIILLILLSVFIVVYASLLRVGETYAKCNYMSLLISVCLRVTCQLDATHGAMLFAGLHPVPEAFSQTGLLPTGFYHPDISSASMFPGASMLVTSDVFPPPSLIPRYSPNPALDQKFNLLQSSSPSDAYFSPYRAAIYQQP